MDACTCVVVGVIAIVIILAFVFLIWKPCNSMDQFYGGGGGATIPEGYDDPLLGNIDVTRREIAMRRRRYVRNLRRKAINEELGDTLDKYKMNAFSRVLVYNSYTFEAVKIVLGLNNLIGISNWSRLETIIRNQHGNTDRINKFFQDIHDFMRDMVREANGFLMPVTSYGQIVFYMHVLYTELSKNNAFPDTENYTMIRWINEKELLPFDIEDTPAMLSYFRAISMSMEHIWTSFVIPFNSDMYDIKYDTARIMFKNISKPVRAINRLFITPLDNGLPRTIDGFEADMAWLFYQVTQTANLANLQ